MLELILKENLAESAEKFMGRDKIETRFRKRDRKGHFHTGSFTHWQINTLSLDPLPLSEFPKDVVFLSKNVTVIILLAAVLSCGLTVPRPHTAGLHYRSVHVNLAHMFCPMRVVPAQDSLHQHN